MMGEIVYLIPQHTSWQFWIYLTTASLLLPHGYSPPIFNHWTRWSSSQLHQKALILHLFSIIFTSLAIAINSNQLLLKENSHGCWVYAGLCAPRILSMWICVVFREKNSKDEYVNETQKQDDLFIWRNLSIYIKCLSWMVLIVPLLSVFIPWL